MKLSSLVWAITFAVSGVSALTPAQWRSQSIYQVLTDRFARTDGSTTAPCDVNVYCGGTWQGIIDKIDYIQSMGFTALWISPVVENLPQSTLDGDSYHGYWAQNIYEVNTNFGEASDLVALSAALHSRGMYLMVDVVTNHMGYAGCGICVDYSIFNPFNEKSYYHPYCPIDYTNETSIQQCWEGDNIVSLPDLRTEDSSVFSVWEIWIKQLVSNYTIDGLRIDSAREVDADFFAPFETAAGVYMVGEVDDGDPGVVCPYQNYISGVLNYPAYFWITQAFASTSGSINNLVNGVNQMKSECADTTLLGSFLENHDNPRFANYTSDISLIKNAIAFPMLADGIPIIYEGQEQQFAGGNVPSNREAVWLSGYNTGSVFYSFITTLNKIRTQALEKSSTYLTYKAYPIYSDSSTIVMRKGDAGYQIVAVFSNLGAGGSSYDLTLSSDMTEFTPGEQVTEILSCKSFTTDSAGNLIVPMAGGLPRIFYPNAQVNGSGVCGASSTTSSIQNSISAPITTISTTLSTVSTKPTLTTCSTPTAVAVAFTKSETTIWGEAVKISGSIPALGSWDTSAAVTLSAAEYTSADPLWSVTIFLPPGTVAQYKYIKLGTDGTVTWEEGPNHTITVPASCATSTAVAAI